MRAFLKKHWQRLRDSHTWLKLAWASWPLIAILLLTFDNLFFNLAGAYLLIDFGTRTFNLFCEFEADIERNYRLAKMALNQSAQGMQAAEDEEPSEH